MFRQYVVKLSSRCDLACDHCYIYEHADQSWRGRPKVMTDRVMAAVAGRVAEHAAAWALPSVRVILHGGEPLLAGVERIRYFARTLRAALPEGCEADLRIQTNGLQLNEEFCDMFLEERIGVGISIDGDRAANDRHRRYADGRSSFPALTKAIELMGSPRYREVFNGLLCTIDVENDPVAVYDGLAAFAPPRIEFLLPHATWLNPPPAAGTMPAPYARWLLAVHRRWTDEGSPMDVRLFTSITDLMAGRSSSTEALGLGPAEVVVVETDGEIEQADSLKTAFDGAPSTGFDVERHSFDQASAHAGFADRGAGLAALGPECRRCPVARVCGGGLYAHRYDGTGFANPSVYCEDLYTLVTSLTGRTPEDAPKYRMGAADFDELSHGRGSAPAFAMLRATQAAMARIRLARLSRSADGEEVRAFIESCDASARAVVTRVLADPFLASADGRGKEAADTLARIAVGCAVLARRPLAVDLVASDDVLAVPAVGILRVPAGPCRVTVDARGAISVNGEPAEPVRHEVRFGPLTLRLEDADPARDRFGAPVAGRLTDGELAAWRRGLADAAGVLAARHPEALAEMAEVLTTLVPLRSRAGRQSSATARSAFGALAVALPGPGGGPDDDPEIGEALALLVLHEFQHLKLGAVLDMFSLHDGSDERSYHVAWRPDARSLEAVMQGVYAHLAVAEYWRRRAERSDQAGSRFYGDRAAEITGKVTSALEAVGGSPALTSSGRRWVAGMASTAGGWR